METATLTRQAPGPTRAARLRSLPARAWERAGLAAVAAGTAWVFFAFPTYANYDSLYSLLWARELVHGQALSFRAYRAPTEHPLAILFGVLLTPLGRHADRVLVACALASFVVLVWGLYRLGRDAFTPLVGAAAAALLCTRLDFGSLAVRGYIDIPYLALVTWAAVLEVGRPRRGTPVLVLLALASLMRPEAWLLTGAYFLWVAWPAPPRRRALYLGLAAAGPLLWAAVDAAVTGDPLFSLHSTSGLAEELGRSRGAGTIPRLLPHYLVQTVKPPVAGAAAVGLALAAWFAPRRTAVPGLLLVSGLVTFVLVGVAGLSVIPRYLVVSQLTLVLFAGVAVGGWTMLRPRARPRRLWAGAAAAAAAVAAAFTVARADLGSVVADYDFRGESRAALVRLLDRPAVRAGLRCGPVSVPNHKLIPDVRWLLDLPASRVVARSAPAAGWLGARPLTAAPESPRAPAQHGLALFVTGQAALTRLIYTTKDDPTVQLPRPRFRRVAADGWFSAYVRC